MSIDCLVNKFSKEKDINLKIDFRKLIIKKFSYFPNSKSLYVSISLYSGGTDCSYRLKAKIKNKNASFLDLKLSQDILSSDLEQTLDRFYFLKKQFMRQIELLKQQYGFNKVCLLGISMGCVTTLMIANRNSNINKVILVVPGSCLAESMWKSIRTQHLKKIIELNGIGLKDLKQQWDSLAPENNLDGMKDKEINVYISQADKIIPGELGECLVDKMYEENLLPRVYKNKHLGHYGTIARFYMFPNINIGT
ncbi:MAG: hypothetical protein ABII97_02375 [Patescibacteria group bacterium]